jgi:hypothetical protein
VRWLQQVRLAYRAHRGEREEGIIAALHNDGVEFAALLRANIQHSVSPLPHTLTRGLSPFPFSLVSRFLLLSSLSLSQREVFDAGWGLRQETRAHVANTARRVGLEVGESLLDREVRAEMAQEREARGEPSTISGSNDALTARIEAIERRRTQHSDAAKDASHAE